MPFCLIYFSFLVSFECLTPRKAVPARESELPPRCNGINCNKMVRQCFQISDKERIRICTDFHNIGDCDQQRAFIVRHIRQELTRHRTAPSHRNKTNYYFLPSRDGRDISVCQTMFLNTLNISEKVMRTALAKVKFVDNIHPEDV